MKPIKNFRRKVRNYLDKMQEARGLSGLSVTEFKFELDKAVFENPEEFGFEYASRDLIAMVAGAIWHDAAPAASERDMPLFYCGGVAIPRTYTIHDVHDPSGFRRIHGKYATLRHKQMDLAVDERKLKDFQLAYDAKFDDYTKTFVRMDGQLDQRIWEYRDAPSGEDEQAEIEMAEA